MADSVHGKTERRRLIEHEAETEAHGQLPEDGIGPVALHLDGLVERLGAHQGDAVLLAAAGVVVNDNLVLIDRINQLRAQEVYDAKTDMVATACPYCLTMLEDGINGLENERQPVVKDIVEIVAESMARKTI